jgi:hypothetical protein
VTDEELRPVVGWSDYFVSDRGRVLSVKRGKSRLLNPRLVRGYPTVYLRHYESRRTDAVHRLMAEAFIGPRPPGAEIRHLDGDRANNALSNLRYGTKAENMQDSVAHGTHANASKTHCPQGHPYDEVNTVYARSGRERHCRPCAREAGRRSDAKRRTRRAGQRVHLATEAQQ